MISDSGLLFWATLYIYARDIQTNYVKTFCFEPKWARVNLQNLYAEERLTRSPSASFGGRTPEK